MKNKKFKIFKKLQYSLEKKSGKRQFFLWSRNEKVKFDKGQALSDLIFEIWLSLTLILMKNIM